MMLKWTEVGSKSRTKGFRMIRKTSGKKVAVLNDATFHYSVGNLRLNFFCRIS